MIDNAPPYIVTIAPQTSHHRRNKCNLTEIVGASHEGCAWGMWHKFAEQIYANSTALNLAYVVIFEFVDCELWCDVGTEFET